MTNSAKEIIAMLNILKENSGCLKNSKCGTCPLYIETEFNTKKRCVMDTMYVLNYEDWPRIIDQEVEI